MKILKISTLLIVSALAFEAVAQSRPKLVDPKQVNEVISYPLSCKVHAKEGTVNLHLLVDETGQVAQYEIITNDHSDFKTACLSGVQKLAFVPATNKWGKPIPGWATITIVFELQL